MRAVRGLIGTDIRSASRCTTRTCVKGRYDERGRGRWLGSGEEMVGSKVVEFEEGQTQKRNNGK